VKDFKMTETKSVLKKYPLWFELVTGLLFGFLNSSFSTFFGKIGSPIFMDTIFAITAAFVGWWSGIVSVILFAIMSAFKSEPGVRFVSALFTVCVMVMICIVRIIYKKRERVSIISLLYVYILCVVFVSIIGAVISTYAFNKFDYPDYNSLRYMTMVFTRQQIPLIASSFLSRLPVNALDKLIAVFAGYGLYLGIEKMAYRNHK
jgi:hypothetical protein